VPESRAAVSWRAQRVQKPMRTNLRQDPKLQKPDTGFG
jgi:hypothetical protein